MATSTYLLMDEKWEHNAFPVTLRLIRWYLPKSSTKPYAGRQGRRDGLSISETAKSKNRSRQSDDVVFALLFHGRDLTSAPNIGGGYGPLSLPSICRPTSPLVTENLLDLAPAIRLSGVRIFTPSLVRQWYGWHSTRMNGRCALCEEECLAFT